MNTTPAFASASQAVEVACAALRFAAAADPAAMPDAIKAECLHGYEQAAAMLTAGRAWILGSYTASHGYSADAEYSAGAWLRHRTKVTKTAARAHVAWVRRAEAHPAVVAALAEGTVLTESVARAICRWTDRPWSAPSWKPCPPRWVRRTPELTSSATMTRCKKPCGG